MNFKIFFLVIVFFIAGFILIKEKNLDQEQSEEENKASILDILPKGPEVGNLAPDFSSEDVYGNKISLSDFRGKKPVLLVFWATWCGYCAQELPDLKVFTQEHENEIQVLVLSSGENKETIKNYIQEKDVNFLMSLDEDRKIWNQYLIRGTPSHFLIDSSGEIVTLRPGLASREDLEIMMTMLTELW